MDQENLVRTLVELAAWLALIFVSVGLKRGLQVVIEAIEKTDSTEVKREVSLNAKGVAAFLINLFKKIAERREK